MRMRPPTLPLLEAASYPPRPLVPPGARIFGRQLFGEVPFFSPEKAQQL